MPFPPVKAVLFDAYGTLFDVHSPVAKLAAEIGPQSQALSELWRTKQLQYTWLRSLMGAHADFEAVTADALDYALEHYEVTNPGLRARLLEAYQHLDAYPEAAEALAAIRAKGITTGILSNGAPNMLSAAVTSSGLGAHLDRVLSIEDVGIYKPHPRAYNLGADRLKQPPEEIGFVSANGWDVAGAACFGFKVIHLNRFGQALEKLPAKPELAVTDLHGVTEALA